MVESQKSGERGNRRSGLDILYLNPDPKDDLTGVRERELPGELRERYWIQAAQDQGVDRHSWVKFGTTLPCRIERHELGRTRNDPGDGFRYVFRADLHGTEGRTEWFEVTEVFEGVEAKDIEAFMRVENGGMPGFDFDPDGFLNGLNMGIPSRASQKRAADKVIEAVDRKLNWPPYKGMCQKHGYGTLIVGLPLWFAMFRALDPLRVENVVDDFSTRLRCGLLPYVRQLRRKHCPFWRIVVVWSISPESMREYCCKASLEIYDDPVYQSLGNMPFLSSGEWMPLLSEIISGYEDDNLDAKRMPDGTHSVCVVRPKKKRKEKSVLVPPEIEEWRRRMEEFGRRHRRTFLEKIKMHVLVRRLEVLCFIRVHGVVGFERWLLARLSPRRRIALFVARRRARWLYRESWRRRTKKGGDRSHRRQTAPLPT